MKRTRVKICGVCRAEDARIAAGAGADAVGMIFHPSSKRNIDVETGRQIIRAAGPFVTPVGVFVDEETVKIVEVAMELGLGVVQLHGNEPAEQVEELGRYSLRVIKVVRVDESLARKVEEWKRSRPENLLGFVLETAATAPGGTGQANDFAAIERHVQAGLFRDVPFIVAGGLTPESVGQVVAQVRPYAVDVSTGVESVVREKSAEKVRSFIDAVRHQH